MRITVYFTTHVVCFIYPNAFSFIVTCESVLYVDNIPLIKVLEQNLPRKRL